MRKIIKQICLIIFLLVITVQSEDLKAEDGYRLWLRYDKISDKALLASYNKSITGWIAEGSSPVLKSSANELQTGLNGLLGKNIPEVKSLRNHGIVVAGVIDGTIGHQSLTFPKVR